MSSGLVYLFSKHSVYSDGSLATSFVAKSIKRRQLFGISESCRMLSKSNINLNLPILQPKLILGLDTKIPNNIHFLNDDEVIYPTGAVVAVHNFHVKKQKFIKLTDKGKNLTHLKLSPNK